jgi:predicted enzyme related to lactoylglutathione lyase
LSEAGIEGVITFLYYKNPREAMEFYENVMGFEVDRDHGSVKIYRVMDNYYVGVVDENVGYLKASKEKPVMITLLVSNVDDWHKYLVEKGVKTLFEPKLHPKDAPRIRHFMLEDPEGYIIEIQRFL